MCIDKGVVVKLFLLPYGCVHMIRLLSIAIFMFPLFLTAETITVKTKAPQNRNAVFQYRVPKGYNKAQRAMYRVLVLFGGRNTDGKADASGRMGWSEWCDELFNKKIMWEYQVEFDVKDEWEENSALKEKTRVEKQENVYGRHFIEE